MESNDFLKTKFHREVTADVSVCQSSVTIALITIHAECPSEPPEGRRPSTRTRTQTLHIVAMTHSLNLLKRLFKPACC